MAISTREALNNPCFQKFAITNAERFLQMDRLIDQPTVTFDHGAEDFYVTATNSPKRQAIIREIKEERLIPITADAFSDIATYHSLFYHYIYASGKNIPIIPTITNFNDQPLIMANHDAKSIPNVFVKKIGFDKQGKSVSHGGLGVSVLKLNDENYEEYQPKNLFEMLQPFIIPPNEYVRDIRVFIVGGKPVVGYINRAAEPLKPENLSGEVIPSLTQFPSAKYPNPREPLAGELEKLVFNQAEKIVQVLIKKLSDLPHRMYSKLSPFGFGSIDFLLDANGTPLPVDFDVSPHISDFENIKKRLGKSLAEYLFQLSKINGGNRNILMIGFHEDGLLDFVHTELKKYLPEEKIMNQPSLIEKAFEEFDNQKP